MKIPQSAVSLMITALGMVALAGAIWGLIPETAAGDATLATDFSSIPANVQFAAPGLTLRDLQGVSHSLSDYRGRIVLVNLWATWCPPCAAEMPNLQHFYEQHRQEGFVVVAVEDGDPNPQVAAFVNRYQLTFPIWVDPTYEATSRAFKTPSLPSSYVVDRGGTVRLMWLGAISPANLEKYLTPLIKE
jgi:thiol-disulfide isomerase/thioredoxin